MISNKQKVNIFIVLLIIVICSLLLINKTQKEKFTNIYKLDYLEGPSGSVGIKGPEGNQGTQGITGVSYEINENNIYLKNKLTLGTKDLVYVTKSNTGDYTQLKLSKPILKNGAKLKIDKNDFEDESMYIHGETNNHTDFYINNKKMYLDGNIEINGNITVQINDLFRSFPKDIIPLGTIFPFYYEIVDKKNLNSGYYTINDNEYVYIEKISSNLYFIKKINKTDYSSENFSYNKNNDSFEFNQTKNDSNKFLINYDGNDNYKIIPYLNNTYYLNFESPNYNFKQTSDTDTDFNIKTTIPLGYEICNGESKTILNNNGFTTTINIPNLNDKYVVNIDKNNSMFAFGKHGGSTNNEHTIKCDDTICEVPTHNHSISYNGYHKHNILNDNMVTNDLNHNHGLGLIQNDNNFSTSINYSFISATGPGTDIDPPLETNEVLHNHDFTMVKSDEHNHGGETSADRTDEKPHNPINIEPNYMKLVYIIKVI